MTLLDISDKLLQFFKENDVFTFSTDFKKIIPISTNLELDHSIVLISLNKLVEIKMISHLALTPTDDYPRSLKRDSWILERPLSHYNQTIELTPAATFAIAEVVNSVGEKSVMVDALQIKERDILNLCQLAYNLLHPPEQKDQL